MIKKDSLKRLHLTTVIEKAKPALEAACYKFVKTKLKFYKTGTFPLFTTHLKAKHHF